MAFLTALRRMNTKSVAAHGLRARFSDWAREKTKTRKAVIAAALAHAAESRTEAAYKRGALIDKRRALMDEWAAFVGSVANAGGEAAGLMVLVEQLGHAASLSQIRAGGFQPPALCKSAPESDPIAGQTPRRIRPLDTPRRFLAFGKRPGDVALSSFRRYQARRAAPRQVASTGSREGIRMAIRHSPREAA
jgi:hypothetical protein